jgi:hypothetical protein
MPGDRNRPTSEEIRPLVLEFFRTRRGTQQMVNVERDVEFKLRQRGFYMAPPSSPGVQHSDPPMPDEDKDLVRQIIWNLIIEGIIVPGASSYQPEVNFLTLSTYGRSVINDTPPAPYDPDGYLRHLTSSLPALDPIVLVYVKESLYTFLRGNLFSSVVMLGVASEQLILLLIDSYLSAISNSERRGKARKKIGDDRPIFTQFEGLRREFEPIKGQLRRDVSASIDIELDGIFNLLRMARNDAGHPTGLTPEPSQVYAYLQVFVSYCKFVHKLMEHFRAHPVT